MWLKVDSCKVWSIQPILPNVSLPFIDQAQQNLQAYMYMYYNRYIQLNERIITWNNAKYCDPKSQYIISF